MSTIFIQEAANLFCGDHDPSNSKHLTITEHKLPTLEEMFEDHMAGGSHGKIEVPTGKMEKLESSFQLNGEDPQLLGQFGFGTKKPMPFFSYGVVRDLRTGDALETKAILTGYLGSIAPDAYKGGDAKGNEYGIKGITTYELWFAGVEKYYFDFWTNTVRIDGQAVKATENSILRLG